MKFISDSQQRLFSLGMTFGGLVSMAGGAMLAFWNPQYLDTRDVSQLYSDGLSDRGSVVARDGKQSHALGSLLLAGGFGLSLAGLFLADGNPRTIRPTVAGPAYVPIGSQPDIAPPPEDVVIAELRENIAQLLHDNKWLTNLMGAPCVIISGISGCGKTTVANNLAILRALFWGWDAIVLDPNARSNLAFGSWSCGKVYGGDPHKPGDIQAIRDKFAALCATDYWGTHPDKKQHKQRLTVVLDEITGWVDGSYELAPEAKRAVSWAQREVRRFGYAAIFLPHSLEKESIGGRELETGKISNFIKYAAVIDLDGKPGEFGEVGWAGTGRFLPAGQPDKKDHWQPIAIPALLSPGKLSEQLADVIEYVGKGLEVAADQTVDSPAFRRFQQLADEQITEDRINQLEASWNNGMAGEYHALEKSPRWDAVRQEPDLWDFALNACHPTGPNEITSMKGRSWAKEHDCRSAEALRDLVERLIAYGCARWTTFTKQELGATFVLIDLEGEHHG
jgi:hypothetical protein